MSRDTIYNDYDFLCKCLSCSPGNCNDRNPCTSLLGMDDLCHKMKHPDTRFAMGYRQAVSWANFHIACNSNQTYEHSDVWRQSPMGRSRRGSRLTPGFLLFSEFRHSNTSGVSLFQPHVQRNHSSEQDRREHLATWITDCWWSQASRRGRMAMTSERLES